MRQLGVPSPSASPRMGSGSGEVIGGELMKTLSRPLGTLVKSWSMTPPVRLNRATSPTIWVPAPYCGFS